MMLQNAAGRGFRHVDCSAYRTLLLYTVAGLALIKAVGATIYMASVRSLSFARSKLNVITDRMAFASLRKPDVIFLSLVHPMTTVCILLHYNERRIP